MKRPQAVLALPLCFSCLARSKAVVATASPAEPNHGDTRPATALISELGSSIDEHDDAPIVRRVPSLWPRVPAPSDGGSSSVVTSAALQLDTIYRSLMELQQEIDLLLPAQPDENVQSCRVWTRQKGWIHHRLRLCEEASRYEYSFDIGTEVDRVVEFGAAVLGRGGLVSDVDRGTVRYDLRFSSRGGGTIEIDYAIARDRGVFEARLPAGTIRYAMLPDGGGRLQMSFPTGVALGELGPLLVGGLDSNTVTIAWRSDGAGRSEMKSCHLEECTLIRECWSKRHGLEFFGFANVRTSALEWPHPQCADQPL